MKSLKHALLTALGLFALAGPNEATSSSAPDTASPDESPASEKRLAMSPAVACEKINGYEQFVPLKDAAITKDEKLLVYYRPLNYTVKKNGQKYQIYFSQEVRVRKRGQKEVLWSKKLVDEKSEYPVVPTTYYLRNTIAVQALTPGDYDLDIILHDELAQAPPAQQVLHFTVKPSPPAEPAASEEETKAKSAKPAPVRRKR
jgi:hypothetical protein